MTETSLSRLIISLGIPTTISMLVTSIYNMADTYFVGRLGESAQGATGILFTLQAIIQAVGFMLGQGSGTLVSKSLAEKDTDEASAYASSAFYASIFVGTLFALFGGLFLTPMLRALGSTETILPYAVRYGACVLASCPFVMASFVLNNILRFEGKAYYSMLGLVTGGILNIFGDWLLVVVYDFGILGAGISTVVSQIISFFMLVAFQKKNAQSRIRLSDISRRAEIYLSVMKIGFPSLIRQGLNSISSGLLNNLTRPFGDAAIAAMSVVNRFSMFVMCVGLGIGQGFQPVAAFNYSAKKYSRVKKSMLITMGIGICFILCLATPGFIFAEKIVYLFQKSPEVIEIGTFALRASCIGTSFLALSVPVNMLYQSTRQTGIASFLSLMRSGLTFIPVLIITTRLWGLFGIQISQPVADILTGFMSIPFMVHFLKTPDEKMK